MFSWTELWALASLKLNTNNKVPFKLNADVFVATFNLKKNVYILDRRKKKTLWVFICVVSVHYCSPLLRK